MGMDINVLFCVAAPLLVMFFIITDKSIRRVLLFLLFGMIACFSAGFVNGFDAQIFGLTDIENTLYTAPIAEECLKAIPIIIFFLAFKPDFKTLLSAAIACGAGFAMLENVLYLIGGMTNPADVLLRGFSTGVMHVMTVSLFAAFLWYVSQKGITRSWFISIMCGFGILASGITLHGCHNLMMNSGVVAQYLGYYIPIVIAAVYAVSLYIWEKRSHKVTEDTFRKEK